MATDTETGDVELLLSRDEARSVGTRPATVALTAEIKLEPGTGNETVDGGGNLLGRASTATLRVLVESNDLGALGTDSEVHGDVLGEETVDLAQRTDLVPAGTLLVLAVVVLESGGVGVLVGDVGVDGHHVAAVVTGNTSVAGSSNVLKSGTLGLLATAERLVAGAGAVLLALVELGNVGGPGTGGPGLGDGLVSLGLRGNGSRSSGSLRNSGGGSGGSSDNVSLVDSDGLVGDDEVALGVSTLVSVAAGVSRGTDGGSQENGGRRELHLYCFSRKDVTFGVFSEYFGLPVKDCVVSWSKRML